MTPLLNRSATSGALTSSPVPPEGLRPVEIEVVRPSELTAEQIGQWTRLQTMGEALGSPFLSPHWPRAVQAAQWPDQDTIRVAILRKGRQTRGFFPARVKGGVGMAAGSPMCDYQGLIAEPGLAVDVRQILGALGLDRYDFCHMPASQTAFEGHVRGLTPSWISRLPFGYDAYAHDKCAESGILKDLDKRRRKAEREMGKVTFTALSRSHGDFEKMLEWKREKYRETGQTDIFAAGWTQRLMEELFASRDPDFGGALFTLHIDDKLAAAQFHLRGADVIHAWIIAHDETHERVSPGLLLFQDIMRWMDDTPFTSIDYGPGDYRFKRQLANAECLVGHGFIGRPSAQAFLRGAAYGIREAAERLPLGKVSDLPGKAMRRMDLMRGLR